MEYNVHDVFRKFVFIIQENIRNLKIIFWLCFETIIILKDETKHLQGINTFSRTHIYSRIILKNMSPT
jgi:hypothetical protein